MSRSTSLVGALVVLLLFVVLFRAPAYAAVGDYKLWVDNIYNVNDGSAFGGHYMGIKANVNVLNRYPGNTGWRTGQGILLGPGYE